MVVSTSAGILLNTGHLLENLIFITLRRDNTEIYYYKTGTGKEVDFIVPRRGKNPLLFQVTESLAEPRARKREINALQEAMQETGSTVGHIITRNDEEVVESAEGQIKIIPAWQFMSDPQIISEP